MHRYAALIEHADDYTLLSPTGGEVPGFENPRGASRDGSVLQDRRGHLEVIQTYASGDLVVLVASSARAARSAIIRRRLVAAGHAGVPPRGIEWQLVHRHADALVHPITFDRLAELARG